MADFRKLLLALIAGALIFGTVASAADFSCQVSAVPTIVRSEAVADFVGDVLLACSGTIPPLTAASGLTASIRLSFLGQPVTVTSKILDTTRNISEATLIIDGAIWPDGTRHPKGYLTAGSGSTMPGPWLDGTQNVYQAVAIGTQELEWQGVVIVGPGSVAANGSATHSILLTNVRINGTGVPANGPIYANVNITSPTFLPVYGNNPPLVANTRLGLTVSNGNTTLKNCDLLPSGTTSFQSSFTEGFGTAFKPKLNTTIVTNAPHYVPGGGYFDESGYNPTGFAGGVGGGTINGGVLDVNSVLIGQSAIGAASQGTQLQLTVTNVPAGVVLSSTSVAANANGLSATISNTLGTVSGTTTTFVWTIDSFSLPAAQTVSDILLVTVTASWGAPPIVGTASAHGRYVPNSTVGTADAVSAVPRFIDSNAAWDANVIVITQSCKTLLLFPYLTSSANYNTGIAITNTSVDPFAEALGTNQIGYPTYPATKAQAGACTLYFYGQSNLTALTSAQHAQTIISIPAGGQFITVLSGGAKGNVYDRLGNKTASCDTTATVVNPAGANTCPDMPGFAGYMIASCNFQWAHGFAFVTDTLSDRTMGYLALVIPDRGGPSGGGGYRLPQDSGLGAAANQGEQLGN